MFMILGSILTQANLSLRQKIRYWTVLNLRYGWLFKMLAIDTEPVFLVWKGFYLRHYIKMCFSSVYGTWSGPLTQQWGNPPGNQPGRRWSRLPVGFLHNLRGFPTRPIQRGAECHWRIRTLPHLSPSPPPSGSHFSGQHPSSRWPLWALPL